MYSRNFALVLSTLLLISAIGCGNGGGPVIQHPSGNYSNADLNGSYVYEIHGFIVNFASFQPYREVGVFTADGNGHITGGADDSSLGAVGAAVTGTYSIAPDGTGFLTMSTSVGNITLAVTFVRNCSQANPVACTPTIYLMEADSGIDSAGIAEQQDQAVVGTTPAGNFVFRVHQEVSAENSGPSGEVGGVTIASGSGSGSMDQNLAGAFSSPNVTWTLNAPGGSGRGTGSFQNATTSFTTNFVYYIVNASKVVLLVTNINAVGSGDAELQAGAVGGGLSGNYAFGSRGDDSLSYAGTHTVGQFTATSGSITGTEDINQDGSVSSNVALTECTTVAASGRVAANVVSGGSCTGTLAQVFWMVSPSRAFFVNASSSAAEDGTADAQSTTSFSNASFTGQYAIVMDGFDISPETLARIGTLQFDGASKLTLNELVNASNSLSGAQSPGVLSGTYSASANGRATGSLNSGSLNLVMYAVSPTKVYLMQTDSGVFTSGTTELQQ